MTLCPILPQHQIDECSLARYLRGRVPGFEGAIELRQFQNGQSNPTYYIQTSAGAYVLRKKPSGSLLRSAHAIDREFTAMRSLAGSDVPVPHLHLLCADEAVIGQMFYIMEYVEGRLFTDPRLLEVGKTERRAMYLDMIRVLARLHLVDYRAVGLENFGHATGYVRRQVERWGKQYLETRVENNSDMENLVTWLKARLPQSEETTIVHGDYRNHNVLFHLTEPRVTAVLDWELATLGHPLSDLAFCSLIYHCPDDEPRGLQGESPASLGLPEEEEIRDAYCHHTGRTDLPEWKFFIAFSLFRNAAIRAGIYKRALDGTAANAAALESGSRYRSFARTGWEIASHD
jgi:aminoglycoside phosphotransferase (APT) family kinase protein